MTPHEKESLTTLRNAGADTSVAEIIRRNDLPATPKMRKTLSAQLCKLREKGLVTSYQENGINYWRLLTKGLAALNGDMPADIPSPEPAPESPPIQADAPDILPDISVPELTEAARIDGIRSGQIPTYPLSAVCSMPGLLHPDLPDPLDYEPDGPDDIDPALVRESIRIRPVAPFARLSDALFVLDTLAIAYCHGMPAYQTEITRIADYLREAAA